MEDEKHVFPPGVADRIVEVGAIVANQLLIGGQADVLYDDEEKD